MCKCLVNAWLMCKCENVQMCKLSPLLAEFISALYYSHILTFSHSHILTFAHLHICIFAHFPHISQALAHSHISTLAHSLISTFAHFLDAFQTQYNKQCYRAFTCKASVAVGETLCGAHLPDCLPAFVHHLTHCVARQSTRVSEFNLLWTPCARRTNVGLPPLGLSRPSEA